MSDLSLKITNPEHLSAPEIKRPYTNEQKFKIAKAAKDFESLMTAMMIKSMNKTTEGMFGSESFGGDVLDTVFETELAKHMSKGKGLGIAQVLYKRLTQEDLDPAIFYENLRPLDGVNNTLQDKIKIDVKSKLEGIDKVYPSQESLKRLDKIDSYIDQASKKYGIDPNIIKSVILAESAGNSKATSSAGAKGLMQLMDGTASEMGVDNPFDAKQNIFGGTKYLGQMLRQYSGDLELSLAAYNAGPSAVDKHNGVPPFEETKNYISRIKGYLNYFNG